MKTPSIFILLYCIEIFGGQFLDAQTAFFDGMMPTTPDTSEQGSLMTTSTNFESPSKNNGPTAHSSTTKKSSVSRASITHHASPSPSPQPRSTTSSSTISLSVFKKECLLLLMVAGGLIIACTILLISTLLLACKVCQLRRRVKMLSSNSDLEGNGQYWVGAAKKNANQPETEAKETTVLMSDLGQTCDETEDDSTKEEKAIESGKKEKEDKRNDDGLKEKGLCENGVLAGDAAKTEEASAGENPKETPATVTENSSTPKPQEEASDSQSPKAVETSSSEAKEEAK